MLARAVQKREKKHIPLAWLKHNSKFDNKVRKTQSLNSATKICSLLTSDFLATLCPSNQKTPTLPAKRARLQKDHKLTPFCSRESERTTLGRYEDIRCLFNTHRSILGVDAESSVGSVFSRAIPICSHCIHQPQRLYVVTRAPSVHKKGYLLPFFGFARLICPSFTQELQYEFGLLARRHRVLLCCDAKLCQNPTTT